jgi:hypothetical protein
MDVISAHKVVGVIALIMVVVAKNVKRLDASDILRDQAVRAHNMVVRDQSAR